MISTAQAVVRVVVVVVALDLGERLRTVVICRGEFHSRLLNCLVWTDLHRNLVVIRFEGGCRVLATVCSLLLMIFEGAHHLVILMHGGSSDGWC
jgi:hypothetical protein